MKTAICDYLGHSIKMFIDLPEYFDCDAILETCGNPVPLLFTDSIYILMVNEYLAVDFEESSVEDIRYIDEIANLWKIK